MDYGMKNNFPEMRSEPTISPEEPPFFAILLKKMEEVEYRLGACTEQIEADLSKIRRIERLATGNEIYEPTDMSGMVLLRLNCIFDILTRLDSVHERKPFDTQEAVEEVVNMLKSRGADGIQVRLFIRVLTKRLTKIYNL